MHGLQHPGPKGLFGPLKAFGSGKYFIQSVKNIYAIDFFKKRKAGFQVNKLGEKSLSFLF